MSGSVRVRFPDGTTVTGSARSAQEGRTDRFDFGLYMHDAWDPSWDYERIDWPDFGLPTNAEAAASAIEDAFARARSGEAVEVGCAGGLGRTGTVLACMAILAGVEPEQAVAWIRANYRAEAVETEAQADWVGWFGRRSHERRP